MKLGEYFHDYVVVHTGTHQDSPDECRFVGNYVVVKIFTKLHISLYIYIYECRVVCMY